LLFIVFSLELGLIYRGCTFGNSEIASFCRNGLRPPSMA